MADKAGKILNGRSFSANNIVAFDDCRHANRFTRILVLLLHANHTSVSAQEDSGTAWYFRQPSEREISLGAGSKNFLHHKVNAARRDIACLTVVRTRLSIDRQANVYPERQVVTAGPAALPHPPRSSP